MSLRTNLDSGGFRAAARAADGGFVQTPREELSPSGVMGDPRLASAEKGEDLFRLGVDRFCDFARDLGSGLSRSTGTPRVTRERRSWANSHEPW